MKTEDLKNSQEYKYGFTTDVENIRAPKGLNEETIKFISNICLKFYSILIHSHSISRLQDSCKFRFHWWRNHQ